MEKNGWYDEYQLNPKLFQCRIDFFIDIIQKLEEDELSLDDDAMKSIEQISMKLPSEDAKAAFRKIKEGSINEGIKQILLFAGKEICSELISKIPLGRKLAKDLFNALSDVLSK